MFNMIGWQARQLEGGYKTYRRATIETLERLPAAFRYIALTGPTGSGKTRLLHALSVAGAQTLDLEQLAAHRGSLLGALPGEPQPSQKWFDTLLVGALRGFDPARPVFVEAESRRIGAVALPLALVDTFHRGDCIQVEASRDDRAAFLLHDYAHLFHDPDLFKQQLSKLIGLHSRERVHHWHKLIDENRGPELARELIDQHYDPAYTRSSGAHFTELPRATRVLFRPNDADVVEQARALLAQIETSASAA